MNKNNLFGECTFSIPDKATKILEETIQQYGQP
jgi:hypothetical protein